MKNRFGISLCLVIHLVAVVVVFAAPEGPIVDGNARFSVLTPAVIRMEYAPDAKFEDGLTFNIVDRGPGAEYATTVEGGWRVVETPKLVLRYRRNSGPFSAENLIIVLKESGANICPLGAAPSAPSSGNSTRHSAASDTAAVGASQSGYGGAGYIEGETKSGGAAGKTSARNLGGWFPTLDGVDKPIALNDGLLTREGWFYLDDSSTELWTGDGWLEKRSSHVARQDGYFFGYGSNYKQGLRDLAQLSGPSNLLPRWAFGVWFSRYTHYTSAQYQEVVGQFRSNRVPLDVLIVDTDFKSPNSWNGWGWNTRLFPDPEGFLGWAHGQGLKVSFNIHATIMTNDPRFAAADRLANQTLISQGVAEPFAWIKAEDGRMPVEPGTLQYTWDWTRRDHAESYFAMHQPFEKAGVDFWWLDDWKDENWVNHLYAQRMLTNGQRPVFFGRIKGDNPWVEHRSTIHFTGDTKPTWELLDFIPYFTIREGNIGLPYVSHDIGSHLGVRIADDMYLRWVQLGTFLPILRLHSSQREGLRLPWEFGKQTEEIASRFLRLRHALIPYLYTVAREAHDTGLPMVRGLYLDYPKCDEAYAYDRQFMLGSQLMIAPITEPGELVRKKVWFPEGTWSNYFTGEIFSGPGVREVSCGLGDMPAFVKAGGIIPLQPYMEHVGSGAPASLVLRVFPGADGAFELYEDDGNSLDYLKGACGRTRLGFTEGSRSTLTIAPPEGKFAGQPSLRSYRIEFVHVKRPVSVSVGDLMFGEAGSAGADGWWYDESAQTLVLSLKDRPTEKTLSISYIGAQVQPKSGDAVR
jgi:hypothetical protein